MTTMLMKTMIIATSNPKVIWEEPYHHPLWQRTTMLQSPHWLQRNAPHLPPNLPPPLWRSPPHLIHSPIDRPHSPPQTTSNQPFCHSTPSEQTDRQTDWLTDWLTNTWYWQQLCNKSRLCLVVSDVVNNVIYYYYFCWYPWHDQIHQQLPTLVLEACRLFLCMSWCSKVCVSMCFVTLVSPARTAELIVMSFGGRGRLVGLMNCVLNGGTYGRHLANMVEWPRPEKVTYWHYPLFVHHWTPKGMGTIIKLNKRN